MTVAWAVAASAAAAALGLLAGRLWLAVTLVGGTVMKTVLGFIALVFFALPVAVAAYLVGGTMWVLGYIDASTVGNAILLGAAAKIAALYEGTAVSYASVQEQDFVLGWKAFLDGTIANLKTTFGITVDGKGWLGPFLGAVGAKLANYASATPTAG